jgi:hypothetical protein
MILPPFLRGLGDQVFTTLGNSTQKVEPLPSSLVTVMVPCIKRTKLSTMPSPNPVPLYLRMVVWLIWRNA